jgi:type IV pilus assembly protein PilA
MKRLVERLHRANQGFTLIELLIIIAMIGLLAAVVVPNVADLSGSGKPEAAKAELATVQRAMDTMMVKMSLKTVTAVTAATSDMISFPDAKNPLSPNYLRSAATRGTYTCTAGGLVSQVSTGY